MITPIDANKKLKNSELLTLVRKQLKDDKQNFVCTALLYVANRHTGSVNAAAPLYRWIQAGIAPYTTVIGWLGNKQGICIITNYSEEAKAYRLAWIDDMIAYWQEQEAQEANKES